MPKCSKCNNNQGKLNKGALCKTCFKEKINKQVETIEDVEPITPESDYDRNVINMIKQQMLMEKERYEDTLLMLKDHVDFLQKEILHKNKLIENMMYGNGNNNTIVNNTISQESNDDFNDTISTSNTSQKNIIDNKSPVEPIQNISLRKESIPITSDFMSTQRISNRDENICESRDTFSGCNIKQNEHSDRYERIPYSKQPSKHPTFITNNFPENDKITYKPTVVPGHSTYAERAGKGKKIALITDSLCGRLKMKELSQHISDGYIYRKAFHGATSQEINFYGELTLIIDKPDAVIINAGSNDLSRNDSEWTKSNILNIVDMCHKYGTSKVFVSAIPFRENSIEQVRDINEYLRSQQNIKNFVFIDNGNIGAGDIWKDGIHLNNNGLTKLGNNFIKFVNNSYYI